MQTREKEHLPSKKKLCLTTATNIFWKGALKVNVLHVLFASHWSQFHNHLTNSVWVFLAKITFTNQLATNCLQPKQTQGFHSLTGLLGLFPSISQPLLASSSNHLQPVEEYTFFPCDRLLPDGHQQVFMPVWLRPYIHSIWQQKGSWLLKSQQWHCIKCLFLFLLFHFMSIYSQSITKIHFSTKVP